MFLVRHSCHLFHDFPCHPARIQHAHMLINKSARAGMWRKKPTVEGGEGRVAQYTQLGAIIRDGDRKSWDPRGPLIWDNFFLFLEQTAPSWRHISALIHARVVGSCVDVVTLRGQLWELRDSLPDFSQWWQRIRQRRRIRALLCTFMVWDNGKGVFFRVENFFNFALWMNIIIHQTHYEKSDWSRAFNQFRIACKLDIINAIYAADIAFIMPGSTSAWLLSPLECSQKQHGWALRFCFWG